MYVIPYSMGPVGSPLSRIGVQVTDSAFVVANMNIMTRTGAKVLDGTWADATPPPPRPRPRSPPPLCPRAMTDRSVNATGSETPICLHPGAQLSAATTLCLACTASGVRSRRVPRTLHGHATSPAYGDR